MTAAAKHLRSAGPRLLMSSHALLPARLSSSELVVARSYTTEQYPYIAEMYKKNYIKYPVQSKQGVQHDYKFTGDERLPTFADRLEGSHFNTKLALQFRSLFSATKLYHILLC